MMKVKDLMDKEVVTVRMESTFRELFILLHHYSINDFPVVDADYHLRGMIYERHLLQAFYPRFINFLDISPDISELESQAHAVQDHIVEEIMTERVSTVSPEDHLMKAGSIMAVEKVATVPVVSNSAVVGIIRQKQIFTAVMKLAADMPFENSQSVTPPANHPAARPLNLSNETIIEKRLYRRMKVDMTVAYKLTSQNAPETMASRGRLASALNISTGGMLLRTELPLPVNTLLNLAFDLSGKNQPIKRIGRVTRSTPSKDPGFYAAGIMFLAMSPEEIRQIDSHLPRMG